MKKPTIALLILLGFGSCVYAATTDETHDFALRLETAALSGLGPGLAQTMGVHIDFYLLSQALRMTFGSSVVFPQQSITPWAALHSIGVEYNFPFGNDQLLMGLAYQRAYLQVARNGLAGTRGWDFHVGYKYRLSAGQDLVALLGRMDAPMTQSSINPNFQIASGLNYGSLGTEFYF